MQNSRFENVQILRGLAACMVVFFHAAVSIDRTMFRGLLNIGSYGVDCFFILSGFIICYVNFDYLSQRHHFPYYLSRRFTRIYLPHFLVMSIILAFYFLSKEHNVLSHINDAVWIPQNLCRTLFLYLPSPAPISPQNWTLTFELLFYTIFAISFCVSRKLFLIVLSIWLAGILWTMSFKSIYLALPAYSRQYFLIISNPINTEFFCGLIIAYAAKRMWLPRSRTIGWLFLAFGIGLLFSSFLFMDRLPVINDLRNIFYGIPFSLILVSALILENEKSGFVKKILLLIGDSSYSIYLIHSAAQVALIWLLNFVLQKSYSMFLMVSFSSIVAGCCLYTYAEKPLLKWVNKMLPWSRKKELQYPLHTSFDSALETMGDSDIIPNKRS
jgi:exopolysaccharide production protein ExoZ